MFKDVIACAKKCYGHPYCESANFHNEMHTCELNSESKAVDTSSSYKSQAGHTYIEDVICVASTFF